MRTSFSRVVTPDHLVDRIFSIDDTQVAHCTYESSGRDEYWGATWVAGECLLIDQYSAKVLFGKLIANTIGEGC